MPEYERQEKNYCHSFLYEQPEKKACESNKTNYIFFYAEKYVSELDKSKENVKNPVYFVVVGRDSTIKDKLSAIIDELKTTSEWLDIPNLVIQCYIFYYSTCSLCNIHLRDTLKNSFTKHCNDSRYSFQFQYIPSNEKPKWICINGGFPRFNIYVQEM